MSKILKSKQLDIYLFLKTPIFLANEKMDVLEYALLIFI